MYELGIKLSTLVDDNGLFDIAAALERANAADLRGVPKRLRDKREQGRIHCNTLVAIYDDPWINPASGGLIGSAVARAFEWTEGHLRRMRREGKIDFVRWVDGVPASHVESVSNYLKTHVAHVSSERANAGREGAKARWDAPTDVSSGS